MATKRAPDIDLDPAPAPAPVAIAQIPIGQLYLDPDNPRRGELRVDDLLASLPVLGMLQPLLVRGHPDRAGDYLVVAGNRRLEAARQLQRDPDPAVRERFATLPCIVRELGEAEAYRDATADNAVRMQLTRNELMCAAVRLRRESHLSIRQVAAAMGRSKSDVQELLVLAERPDLLALVGEELVSPSTAVRMARMRADEGGEAIAAVRAGQITTAKDLTAWQAGRCEAAPTGTPALDGSGDPPPDATAIAPVQLRATPSPDGAADVAASAPIDAPDDDVPTTFELAIAHGPLNPFADPRAAAIVDRTDLQIYALVGSAATCAVGEALLALRADVAMLRERLGATSALAAG